MTDSNGFTPTEARMIALFSDGQAHAREELHSLLDDDLAPVSAIRAHLSNIRGKLPNDENIVCELKNRRIYYRHVRLLYPPETI